ncbi:MAG: erythrose-4-phosphate dehydrogenase [Desulfobulbaceae bacterium]|nr:erythrose-4-phosphate dehydrogenase [Desulfobulbaceae bacterium]
MAHNIAINGYGRIGRAILRAYYESDLREKFRIKAINEISSIEKIAYLTKYDSIYGSFPGKVSFEENCLHANGDTIPVTFHRKISNLPWTEQEIDIVLECSGCYRTRGKLTSHIDRGAGKVILSCPGDDNLDATIVYGINDHLLTENHTIISNASCTTNCIVPVIKVLDDAMGIEHGMITTLHSMMNDQPILDAYHLCNDLRRTRSGVQSMVPVATELARGVERILPHLSERFQSASMRVPVTNVSAIDLTVAVSRDIDSRAVNTVFQEAANGHLQGVLGYTEEPMVSSDFNKNSHSAVIDGSQTQVSGSRMVRVLAWFDNEWGYANRMLDTAFKLSQL